MRSILICTALTGALVSPALAHTGVGQTNSFVSGIAHPLGGADHILAMTAVGVWGVLTGGRAVWIWPTAFVADAAGDGTTLYTAAPGAAFRPAFGLASRARHAAGGAAELGLDGIPGLRRDVDTPSDLREAVALGLGSHSAPLAAELLRCAPRGR